MHARTPRAVDCRVATAADRTLLTTRPDKFALVGLARPCSPIRRSAPARQDEFRQSREREGSGPGAPHGRSGVETSGAELADQATRIRQTMNEDPEIAAIVRALAAYLRDNPLACDTPQGVALWWLPLGYEITTQESLAALKWMQSNGLVEELAAADGRLRYRLMPGVGRDELARVASWRNTSDGMQ
ncbi:hypothetical protein [Burkholderia ubonensis]|uniref:hypothetical protein n=1 Tax=Burkholderia ubonensis TaxID=101571 RepID=UPI00114CEF5C|nr:hypothetical protein [Burkholderia ubonensis]